MKKVIVSKLTDGRKNNYLNVYIGRGSVLGNPFVVGVDGTRKEVIDKFRVLTFSDHNISNFIDMLVNNFKNNNINLMCYCKPKSCHGDIIREVIISRYNDRIIMEEF